MNRSGMAVSSALVIAASAVLAVIPAPASAKGSSYTWTLTCKVEGTAWATVSWDWLQDGQVIVGAGGGAWCGGSGGGTRPANANGITASVTATAEVNGATGWRTDTLTNSGAKSFSPGGSFTLKVAASASVTAPCFRYIVCKQNKLDASIHATFTIAG